MPNNANETGNNLLTVVGLGPGNFNLLTLESYELIRTAKNLRLRTAIHPTVEELKKRGIKFASYDEFYDRAENFAGLYEKIARDLLTRAQGGEKIVYAVPGSPLVAERTVANLRAFAPGYGVTLEIYPGMSFLETLCAKLGIDPIDGLIIADAADLGKINALFFPLVVTQIYDRRIASEAKLQLMELLPDEAEIIYVHNLSLSDESIRKIPLYEIDRQPDIDHLTSLYVPLGE